MHFERVVFAVERGEHEKRVGFARPHAAARSPVYATFLGGISLGEMVREGDRSIQVGCKFFEFPQKFCHVAGLVFVEIVGELVDGVEDNQPYAVFAAEAFYVLSYGVKRRVVPAKDEFVERQVYIGRAVFGGDYPVSSFAENPVEEFEVDVQNGSLDCFDSHPVLPAGD